MRPRDVRLAPERAPLACSGVFFLWVGALQPAVYIHQEMKG